jgi:hypothetical protein
LTPAVAATVAGLGVFHGLNPAMGWLFAVALGQQRRPATPMPRPRAPIPAATAAGSAGRSAAATAAGSAGGLAGGLAGGGFVGAGSAGSAGAGVVTGAVPPAVGRRPAVVAAVGAVGSGGGGRAQWAGRLAVLRALPAIAAGHLASVGVIAVAFAVTASAVASRAAAIGGGVLLVGLGLWRLLSTRHFRWVGMRLSDWELGTWSFLMSSVHGAGLMLIPVLAAHHHSPLPATASITTALAAAAVHTAAMLITAGAIALLVTGILGLSVLRHAWLNVDRLWALALLIAGATTLLLA